MFRMRKFQWNNQMHKHIRTHYLRWRFRHPWPFRNALRWCVYVQLPCALVPSSIPQRLSYGATTAQMNKIDRCVNWCHFTWIQNGSSNRQDTYPKFLLSFRCHETLLCLLGFGGLLHTLTHLSTLALDFGLLGLLSLKIFKRIDKNEVWRYKKKPKSECVFGGD